MHAGSNSCRGRCCCGALNDEQTDYSEEHTVDADDFASSWEDWADDDTMEENVVQINGVMLYNPVIHDHVHCPPLDDMSNSLCGVPYSIFDCEDISFALLCFA